MAHITNKPRRCLRSAVIPATVYALIAVTVLSSAASAQDEAAASDDFNLSQMKAELQKNRNSAPAKEDSSGEFQKKFKQLAAQESEILSRMNKQQPGSTGAKIADPVTITDKPAPDVDLAIDNFPGQQEGEAEVQFVSQRNKGDLDDLKQVDPADLQAKEKAEGQERNVDRMQKQNAELRQQLDTARKSARELAKELEETRNRLIIAETQVERLSSVIEERNKSSLARYSPPQQKQLSSAQQSATRSYQPARQQPAEKAADEMPVATVVADKAYLRTGPGKDNSPLMSISKGTRLAIETRQGEWYRVISPTGTRAWISSDVLAFGPTQISSPTRTVKGKGFDAGIEEEQASATNRQLAPLN